jgi:hypothetical protein
MPRTKLHCDGSFITDITTGASDREATENRCISVRRLGKPKWQKAGESNKPGAGWRLSRSINWT